MEKKLYELTNPQKSIWLTEEFSHSTVNNISGNIYIHEPIQIEFLKKSLNLYVEKNEAIRIRIIKEKDTPKQYIHEFVPFPIEVVSLSSKEDLKNFNQNIVKKHFDFIDSDLFSFTIFQYPDHTGGLNVTFHHIISDAWTMSLFIDEVMDTYTKLVKNTPINHELNPSYTNYITSEKEYLASSKLKKDKEYWDNFFLTTPELAKVANEPAVSSTTAVREVCHLEPNTQKSIIDFCDEYRCSIYTFFMAIFSIYLSKINNITEPIIGTPVLNRSNFKEKNTAGMYISTIPFKANVDSSITFEQFLRNVSQTQMSIFRHQKYPYSVLLEDLKKKYHYSENLYQVALSYQNARDNRENCETDYSAEWLFTGHIVDPLEIHFYDIDNTGNVDIFYDYQVNCLTKEEIVKLHERILAIISQVISSPALLLQDIEIVTPEEKEQIVTKFNDTAIPYDKTNNLVSVFEEQVKKHPNDIALVFEGKSHSYEALNQKANQLAHYLTSLQVKENEKIAILLPRSYELIISMLAIKKANCAYLLVEKSLPMERVKYMLENAGVKFVITNKEANATGFTPLLIDEIPYDNFSKDNLKLNYLPEGHLSVVYTSGSTGMPKGILVKNSSILNLVLGYSHSMQAHTLSNFISICSVSFDMFAAEVWVPLLLGKKLILTNEEESKNPILMASLIETYHIEFMLITSSRMNLLLLNENTRKYLSNLKAVQLGGEVLEPQFYDKLIQYTNSKIYNGYGPSETTSCATCKLVTNSKDITIGTPLPNIQVYICNKSGNLCPPNIIGELCICGDGVSYGYINQPELTNKSFVKNRFGEGLLYKTGDLAKFLPNGEIEFVGRTDSQVKIRGLRVELEEINRVISEVSGIEKSITVIKKLNGIDSICCYYTGKDALDSLLKNELSQKLPYYMVPSHFMHLTEFPLTINGKVDTKQLPDFIVEVAYVAPETATEKTICNLWQELFKLDSISVTANFFELGGDSLGAIRLVAQMEQELNIELKVNDIFTYSTPRGLAQFIDTLIGQESAENEQNLDSKIQKVQVQKYYPISSAQKRIYTASSMDTNSILYNIAGGIIVDKQLDTKLLQKCFEILIKKHEVLRTHFDVIENEIVQVVEDKINFTLPCESITTDKSDVNTTLNAIYAKFIKPFDLSKAPLFRAKVALLSNQKTFLLIDMHHIISDGASMSILLQELCNLYNHMASEKNTELSSYITKDYNNCYNIIDHKDNELSAESQIDYKDFAVWEKSQFEKQEWKQIRDFWINQYQDEIPLLNMPTTFERPSVQSFEGNNYYTKLPKEVFQKVNTISRSLGITPFMLMLSCYYILLSKYTSSEDIVIGTPIVGRQLPELSNMLGMFVNTLAFRNKVPANSNFTDFASQIKEYCLSAFQNQAYPFDELVKELKIKRDTSRSPLIDVMFAYQNDGYPTIQLGDANVEYFTPNNPISKFDLTMEIIPIENEFSVRFEYCTKLFDEDFIKQFSSHYINILNSILENPNVKIADIDMLSKQEKKQILHDFNDTHMDYPRDKTIVDLFEEQVNKTPERIAVLFENQKLTYTELNQKANQLAICLIQNNVKPGDIVGIYLNKSLEVIISMFAILKAGAAFLPLDTDYPEDRLNYIIKNSAPKAILTSKTITSKDTTSFNDKSANESDSYLVKITSGNQIPTILVDLTEKLYQENDTENIKLNLSPEDLMYIMYTSGSTGNPKGVMVKHKNIIRLAAFPNFIHFDDNEVMVQTGTIVFDACIFEIFGSLLHGFKLYVLKKENILDVPFFTNLLKEKKVTILFLTTGLFNQLGMQNPAMFSNLKYLLTGGDVISKTSIQKIRSQAPDLKLINCYGPTENGSYSTCYSIIGDEKIIPIGKPITNSTAYVVSSTGQLCPIGVPGELWVGGDGVARGYINRPDLTKEQFIENPFDNGITTASALQNSSCNTNSTSNLLYKTGDLVKWLPDGNIAFLGRIDNQVKIRGFRIELSEIDRKLLLDTNIKQALTLVQNINSTKTLCSYIVADKQIDMPDLKKKLEKHLPSYMIPTFIMQLKEFPLNISGKLNLKAFPIPDINQIKKEIVPPRNEIDKRIIYALSQVLTISNISIEDSFFDLGGDSLSAIHFTNILSQAFETTVTVSDVFNHPIMKDLSDYISSLANLERPSSEISQCTTKRDYYPASSAQKRIYYASSMDTNSVLYNISGGIIVDKPLDKNLLEKCFQTLIQRHEVLRTKFAVVDTDIVQIVEDSISFTLPYETQIGSSTSNAENSANHTTSVSSNSSTILNSNIQNIDEINSIYANFIRPFDLKTAPLFRAKAVELSNHKMLLLLDMHHIISDGTSLGILLKELCDLYNGNTLPENQVDYKDFTLWEKEQFETENFKQAKEFWVNQFKDEIPLLNMPSTFARPSVQSFEGANYYTKLPKETFEKINTLSKTLGVTPYMLMLSVYYILLSKYSSSEDIVVGTPIVGRELPELSSMLGMFVNTLALRNKVEHSSSFHNFVNQVKQYCLSAFKNQTYPFDELVKALNVKRDVSRNPLFDVMFIYQNNGYPAIHLKNNHATYFIPDSNIAKFDLSLEIVPMEEEFSVRFEYCTKLFDKEFIARLSSHYINILNIILENADIKIADIDMLSEEEKHTLLHDFNNTYMDYPRDKTIVDLFEEQVEKTPNSIAVVFEGQQLTYRELNEKANQLAHFLVNNGISHNSIVGIMLPRSLEIMIAFLGVLKAGACYIPIDPTFPKERIEYMLENSNASMVLKINKVKGISFKDVVNIDVNHSIVYQYETKNLHLRISPESPAYTIYTSGSTGKPKGVVLKHLSLMNLACYLNNVVDYFKHEKPGLAIASITTISFDIFLFETIISLQKGLKVIIANEAQQTNPKLLDELIAKHDIKAIQMTPSRMDVFINNKEYMPHLANLEYITLAGEALPDELKNKILELGNITVYNGYGPSETTVFSTFTDVTSYSKVTIGRPLANTYVYILDKDMHLCPIGIPGELYISGEGVGKGYLNKPDLTNASFTTDKFDPNWTMYKTGDLVKFLPNGELDYIGRVDNQVKIRGLRIELDEIQKWIMQYQDINKVILSAHTDKGGRQYLVAYLTVHNRISINDLKIYLGKHIPKYMIPTYFMVLDEFPYLPNGKIDKKSLPLPKQDTTSNKKYVAPTNQLEIEITQIFEGLLSISPISITDNFFDIGGDSLLAMSMQLELLKLHINISYSDIFMYPTVKELAEHISSDSKRSLSKIDEQEMSKFDPILQKTIYLPEHIQYNPIGNILLTGVTGFLGAHILDSLLTIEKGTIYCLIRTEPGLTIEQKLLNKLHYYFDTKYDNLIYKRIIPIQADIGENGLGLSDKDLQLLIQNIDVVINSAAKVSHYGNYGDYKKINVDGVQNLVDFCMKYKKRFYQISTLSVSGNSFIDSAYIEQDFKEDVDFNENNFYIHQSLDNVYIRSKFEAEKVILTNILNGLDGYIIRVGNLMNRLSDGKFQPNVNENAYINRLLTFYQIGYIPDYLLNGYLELTPIDCCANAVVKIVGHNCKDNRIFHLLNHKNVNVTYFIDTLNKVYDKIEIVNNDTFLEVIDRILNNTNNKHILSGLINDFDENRLIVYSSPVKIKSDFTIKYLDKIGFDWPELKENYILHFLKFFHDLNLLNRKDVD